MVFWDIVQKFHCGRRFLFIWTLVKLDGDGSQTGHKCHEYKTSFWLKYLRKCVAYRAHDNDLAYKIDLQDAPALTANWLAPASAGISSEFKHRELWDMQREKSSMELLKSSIANIHKRHPYWK